MVNRQFVTKKCIKAWSKISFRVQTRILHSWSMNWTRRKTFASFNPHLFCQKHTGNLLVNPPQTRCKSYGQISVWPRHLRAIDWSQGNSDSEIWGWESENTQENRKHRKDSVRWRKSRNSWDLASVHAESSGLELSLFTSSPVVGNYQNLFSQCNFFDAGMIELCPNFFVFEDFRKNKSVSTTRICQWLQFRGSVYCPQCNHTWCAFWLTIDNPLAG